MPRLHLYPDEVRRFLAGAQTEVRRLVRPQPRLGVSGDGSVIRDDYFVWEPKPGEVIPLTKKCSYRWSRFHPWPPGAELWCSETWAYHPDAHPDEAGILYRATDPGWDENDTGLRWRSAMCMPERYSRLRLTVLESGVERVGEITEEQARAEGCLGRGITHWAGQLREQFCRRWNSRPPHREHPFESNPWVWWGRMEVKDA